MGEPCPNTTVEVQCPLEFYLLLLINFSDPSLLVFLLCKRNVKTDKLLHQRLFLPFSQEKRDFKRPIFCIKTFSGVFPEALSYPSPHLKEIRKDVQKCTILRLTIQPILIETSRRTGSTITPFLLTGDPDGTGISVCPFPPQRLRPQDGKGHIMHSSTAVLAGGRIRHPRCSPAPRASRSHVGCPSRRLLRLASTTARTTGGHAPAGRPSRPDPRCSAATVPGDAREYGEYVRIGQRQAPHHFQRLKRGALPFLRGTPSGYPPQARKRGPPA